MAQLPLDTIIIPHLDRRVTHNMQRRYGYTNSGNIRRVNEIRPSKCLIFPMCPNFRPSCVYGCHTIFVLSCHTHHRAVVPYRQCFLSFYIYIFFLWTVDFMSQWCLQFATPISTTATRALWGSGIRDHREYQDVPGNMAATGHKWPCGDYERFAVCSDSRWANPTMARHIGPQMEMAGKRAPAIHTIDDMVTVPNHHPQLARPSPQHSRSRLQLFQASRHISQSPPG